MSVNMDEELEQLNNEIMILITKEKIMKNMLSTMEEMNLLLRFQSSKCLCGQSTDIKLKTKLNVLNTKYNELKASLDTKSNEKPISEFAVIRTQPNLFPKSSEEFHNSSNEDDSQDSITQDLKSQQSGEPIETKSDECEEDIEAIEKLDEMGDSIVSLNDSDVEDDEDCIDLEFSCEFADSKSGLLCQKKFTSKKLLLRHVIGHSGSKPWFCEESDCDYRAVQRNHLIGHIRKSHTGRYQFRCDWYCNPILSHYQIQSLISDSISGPAVTSKVRRDHRKEPHNDDHVCCQVLRGTT